MPFDAFHYDALRVGCQRSAFTIATLIHGVFQPETMIDVGGGEGWFAAEFAKLGCEATVVDSGVPARRAEGVSFVECDLEHEAAKGDYDLAVCLEVAEHLTPSGGVALVTNLTELAPIVVFSAAAPGQGGMQHINEQWPCYWADLFDPLGYVATEDFRWMVWEDETVESWYRQNLLVFARPETLKDCELSWTSTPVSVIHPDIWGAYRPI
jgi:hypothetical protein